MLAFPASPLRQKSWGVPPLPESAQPAARADKPDVRGRIAPSELAVRPQITWRPRLAGVGLRARSALEQRRLDSGHPKCNALCPFHTPVMAGATGIADVLDLGNESWPLNGKGAAADTAVLSLGRVASGLDCLASGGLRTARITGSPSTLRWHN